MISKSLVLYAEDKLNFIYKKDGIQFYYFNNENFKNNADKIIYFTTTNIDYISNYHIRLSILLMSVNFNDIANLNHYNDDLIIKKDSDFSGLNADIFSMHRHADLIIYKDEYYKYNIDNKIIENSISIFDMYKNVINFIVGK